MQYLPYHTYKNHSNLLYDTARRCGKDDGLPLFESEKSTALDYDAEIFILCREKEPVKYGLPYCFVSFLSVVPAR